MADRRSRSANLTEPLTGREHEILICLAEGLSNQEIANQLHLAEKTVRWYNSQIYSKLNVGGREEAVAQARARGLLVATVADGKHNLPAQATPFIGRQYELGELAVLLNDTSTRLITILAPGGMGKTRLSLETARSQVGRYTDGVFFVPLAPVSAHTDLVTTIAENIGFVFNGENPPLQQIIDFLHDRAMLLVLDNFEHLLEGVSLVAAVMQAAPGVRVLVTSRERLNLQGETVYTLRGLDFPSWATPEDALEYDAVKLFIRSANRVRPDFILQPDDLDFLVRICRLTAGMPLGIELAAGWVDVLSLEQIAAEIQGGINILETEMRDVPERQRSVRATFERSWERLTDEEQRVFRCLSVFRGGFTIEAARIVANADVRLLRKLANKALVQTSPGNRHDIHELLRQYAADKLFNADEAEATVRCHVDYFTAQAEQAAPELNRANYGLWLNILEAEHDNLRAALDWSQKHDLERGLRLVVALHSFWRTRGHALEGLARSLSLLTVGDAIAVRNPTLWANALTVIAWLAYVCGDDRLLRPWAQEALRFSREIGDTQNVMWALRNLGQSAAARGDSEEAERFWTEGLALAREKVDYQFTCLFLNGLGILTRNHGDYSQALIYHREAVQLLEQLDDRSYFLRIRVLWEMGISWLYKLDYEQARRHFMDALSLSQEPIDFAYCLEAFGGLAVVQNQPERAARLLGAAEAIRETTQTPRVKMDQYHEWFIARTREQLSDAAFADAWAAGQAQAVSAVVAELLAENRDEQP